MQDQRVNEVDSKEAEVPGRVKAKMPESQGAKKSNKKRVKCTLTQMALQLYMLRKRGKSEEESEPLTPSKLRKLRREVYEHEVLRGRCKRQPMFKDVKAPRRHKIHVRSREKRVEAVKALLMQVYGKWVCPQCSSTQSGMTAYCLNCAWGAPPENPTEGGGRPTAEEANVLNDDWYVEPAPKWSASPRRGTALEKQDMNMDVPPHGRELRTRVPEFDEHRPRSQQHLLPQQGDGADVAEENAATSKSSDIKKDWHPVNAPREQ